MGRFTEEQGGVCARARPRHMRVSDFIEAQAPGCVRGPSDSDSSVLDGEERFEVGGQIGSKRVCGKLCFFQLIDSHDSGCRLQVIVQERTCGAATFASLRQATSVGGFSQFRGVPAHSRRGDFSLLVTEMCGQPQQLQPEAANVGGDAARIRILYQDPHVLVVEKPAGMLVHPDGPALPGEKVTLLHQLAAQLGLSPKPKDNAGVGLYPMHRIDRDTSGAVIFALSLASAQFLRAEWSTFTKQYVALVDGSQVRARTLGVRPLLTLSACSSSTDGDSRLLDSNHATARHANAA